MLHSDFCSLKLPRLHVVGNLLNRQCLPMNYKFPNLTFLDFIAISDFFFSRSLRRLMQSRKFVFSLL